MIAKFTAAYALIYGYGEFEGTGPDRKLVGGSILLLRQKKSKKWQLPGGDVVGPKTPDLPTVLKKSVHDMCGLEVEVGRMLGAALENGDSIISGHVCLIRGGGLVQRDIDDETDMARFCTYAEIANRSFASMDGGYAHAQPLVLIGPRTTRFTLDALSLKKEPLIGKPPFDTSEFAALAAHPYPLALDVPTLIDDHFYQPVKPGEGEYGSVRRWSRLRLATEKAKVAS